MKIKKLLFSLILSIAIINVSMAEQKTVITNNFIISYSCLSYSDISVGYEYATKKINGFHGFGQNIGLQYQFQFETDYNIIRLYYNIYTWDIPLLIGLGIPYNIDEKKLGVAPQVGLSFFGNLNIAYRYNIFINTHIKYHEIVFDLSIPLF